MLRNRDNIIITDLNKNIIFHIEEAPLGVLI